MSLLSAVLSQISRGFYRGLEGLDNIIGLPHKISESFDYRNSWKKFLYPSASSSPPEKYLWIHGSSLGELEDLAAFFTDPELLKIAGFKFSEVLLSSSSPSALKSLQSWQRELGLAYAGPLVPEKKTDIEDFLKHFHPLRCFVLSHSDVWPFLLEKLQSRVDQFLWLPNRLSQDLSFLTRVFLDPHKTSIGSLHPQDLVPEKFKAFPLHFIGSTRLDRILARIQRSQKNSSPLEKYMGAPLPNKISLLGASFWPEDAQALSEALNRLTVAEQESFQIVVIPHETKDPYLLARIQNLLPKAKILALEGILLESYQNFNLAFIGGGYGAGLHNVLEGALWKIPLLCGPRIRNQSFAPRLIQNEQLFVASTPQKLSQFLKAFLQENTRLTLNQKSERSAQTLLQESGASHRLAQILKELSSRSSPPFRLSS